MSENKSGCSKWWRLSESMKFRCVNVCFTSNSEEIIVYTRAFNQPSSELLVLLLFWMRSQCSPLTIFAFFLTFFFLSCIVCSAEQRILRFSQDTKKKKTAEISRHSSLDVYVLLALFNVFFFFFLHLIYFTYSALLYIPPFSTPASSLSTPPYSSSPATTPSSSSSSCPLINLLLLLLLLLCLLPQLLFCFLFLLLLLPNSFSSFYASSSSALCYFSYFTHYISEPIPPSP